MSLIDSDADLAAALDRLAAQCPFMARAVRELGPPPLRRRPGGFEGLAQIVVFQQISTEAGRAIWGKVGRAFGALSPDLILRTEDADLKAAGLSAPKVRTLRAVAEAVAAGRVDFDRLAAMGAEEAHAMLTAVKGIGPWTTDIYLLFCLGHPDAWPAGDLALQIGAADLLGLENRPSAKDMAPIGERWRPWRAVAARMLWAYYGARRDGRIAEPLTA